MYELYKGSTGNAVSYPYYSREFHAFKLKFKKPKQDTCHKCKVWQIKINAASETAEKQRFFSEKDDHLRQAEEAYDSKKFDKEKNQNTEGY